MKKIISFSLYGNSKLYNQGFLENLKVIPDIYPGWTPRVYIARNSPILSMLWEQSLCEIVETPAWEGINNRFDSTSNNWHNNIYHVGALRRFAPAFEKDIDYVIFRDTDSLVNQKEADAVNEWIESKKLVHRMLDCEAHYGCGIMAGMCGVKGGVLHDNFKQLLINFTTTYQNRYNQPWIFCDVYFLQEYIFNQLGFSLLTHGIKDKPFPGNHTHLEIGRPINEEWRNQPFR